MQNFRRCHQKNLSQEHLQRLQRLIAQIQHAVEEIVIPRYGVIQRQHRKGWLYQRDGDVEQLIELACPFKRSVLVQVLRHCLHGGAAYHHIVSAQQHRQNHCKARVVQPDPRYHHVRRNQPAGKIHGEHHKEVQLPPQKEVAFAQRISRQAGENHVCNGSKERIDKRVAVRYP